jgi:hypothetical protein
MSCIGYKVVVLKVLVGTISALRVRFMSTSYGYYQYYSSTIISLLEGAYKVL